MQESPAQFRDVTEIEKERNKKMEKVIDDAKSVTEVNDADAQSVTLKGVSAREVFNALDALELLFEHSNVRWVKEFLDDHGIVVVC